MLIAVFPGSFDPLTNGHLDIIERASVLFDKVIVAVGVNTTKTPLFTDEEKIALIEEAVGNLDNVEVSIVSGLTVDFMKEKKARYIVRGLRNSTDFEYERDIAAMNYRLDGVETVLLLARPENQNISSTVLKEVARFGGQVNKLVPANIAKALEERFRQ